MISVTRILSAAQRHGEDVAKAEEPSTDGSLYRIILDAIPSPVFVIGEDMRIVDFNASASRMLLKEHGLVVRLRLGGVLHCLNSTEGCGNSPACHECIIREGVMNALRGQKQMRRKAQMTLVLDGETTEAFFLVTTVPLQHNSRNLALVILEDISELTRLHRLLPICANCKRIRNDEQYWQSVESYFASNLDVNFTHGICPDCARKLYPEFIDQLDLTPGSAGDEGQSVKHEDALSEEE